MSVLDDIANAMNSYPQDETTIEVVNVDRVGNSSDTAVNAGEIWEFHVKLTNNGHVDMTAVSLHVLGLNGTMVREKSTDTFVNSMVVGNLNPAGGGGSVTTRAFQFQAPPGTEPAGTELFHVHIQEWDAGSGFDHPNARGGRDLASRLRWQPGGEAASLGGGGIGLPAIDLLPRQCGRSCCSMYLLTTSSGAPPTLIAQ